VRYDLALRLGPSSANGGRAAEAEPHFQYVEQAERALRQLDFWLPEVLKRPEDVSLRYRIGTTVLRYRSVSDGVRWLKSVLEIEPEHPDTHRVLAEYYTEQGDLPAAERHRQRIGKPADSS
jgi:predicted Zn-dependent protease